MCSSITRYSRARRDAGEKIGGKKKKKYSLLSLVSAPWLHRTVRSPLPSAAPHPHGGAVGKGKRKELSGLKSGGPGGEGSSPALGLEEQEGWALSAPQSGGTGGRGPAPSGVEAAGGGGGVGAVSVSVSVALGASLCRAPAQPELGVPRSLPRRAAGPSRGAPAVSEGPAGEGGRCGSPAGSGLPSPGRAAGWKHVWVGAQVQHKVPTW